MRTLLLFTAVLAALPAYANSACEISGDARLWAYDECLWRHETDDTLHPGVIKCVKKNQALVSRVGPCKAKRIFKDRICTLARKWKLNEPDPDTCMSIDKPLGASVLNGGI